MIQLTKDTDLSRLSLRFVAGEDDANINGSSPAYRERWVLNERDSGKFWFCRFPHKNYCHDGYCDSRPEMVKRFLSRTDWNVELYSFQSEEEMNQWLNSPFK